MSDVLENAKTHGYVYAAIVETFGERCPDFEPECLTCSVWAEYDGIRKTALEEAAKVADRAVIPMCETSADHIAAAIRAMKDG